MLLRELSTRTNNQNILLNKSIILIRTNIYFSERSSGLGGLTEPKDAEWFV